MVKIAITGTPGIGKSCFLLYFILRLLYESTDDEPNIVIFHPEPNSFEEISDCREGIFSDLSEDVVSELFDKAGGVPRSILLKPSREKEPKTTVEAGLEDIEDALRHVRDPAKIHLCFMEEKETIQFSSQLMHLVPGSRDYLFANSRRQWASRYVLAKFLNYIARA
ncbi:hypothetical protein EV426DRAFT_576403 [Tirmania nivea]|nr:hypothetical protein EV426DRAFT_576403 [Tirmania nivea]